MKTKSSDAIRRAGFAALLSGILYIAIQAIHPADTLSSVSTPQWAIVHYLSLVMSFLGLLGIVGLYVRQAEATGWLGLAGCVAFSLFYAFAIGFQFVEAFVSPLLAAQAPRVVEGLLGIVNGHATELDLGVLPAVWSATGVCYLLGGVLFGAATFRAGVLPRWAGGLLVVGTLLPILGSSLVPHPFDRIFAVPVGVALAWLGYALWSERRESEQPVEPLSRRLSPQLRATGAE
jgi:hypothetical protein